MLIICDGNTKGGVLTCVPKHFQPIQYQSFTNGRFDSICSCSVFYKTLCCLSQTYIYHSPNLILQETLLSSLAPDLPAVILGDFNSDTPHGKDNVNLCMYKIFLKL